MNRYSSQGGRGIRRSYKVLVLLTVPLVYETQANGTQVSHILIDRMNVTRTSIVKRRAYTSCIRSGSGLT
jgi:hypothetical protein